MTIYRAEPLETESIEIELNKKGGKNLGIGFFTTNPHGLFITDVVRLVPIAMGMDIPIELLT